MNKFTEGKILPEMVKFSLPILAALFLQAMYGAADLMIVGQFGDLLASTFKRWAGVKDYSNLFPGHGGVMDRLDSAMVAAPIVAVAFAFFI